MRFRKMEELMRTNAKRLSIVHRRAPILFIIAAAALLAGRRAEAATTLWVNDNSHVYSAPGVDCEKPGYSTIQSAINAAVAGDFIRVCPGTYTENITVTKPNLSLVSTDGAAATAIRAAISNFVVQILQPGATLQGFGIFPLGNGKADIGVNVAIQGTAGTEIAYNVITRGRIGINLGCSSRASTVYHNVVNSSAETGINVDTCENSSYPGGDENPADNPGSSDNAVHHNTVCGGLMPFSIAVGGGRATDNHVHHNKAVWITVAGKGNQVHDNAAELFKIDPFNLDINNMAAQVCR